MTEKPSQHTPSFSKFTLHVHINLVQRSMTACTSADFFGVIQPLPLQKWPFFGGAGLLSII